MGSCGASDVGYDKVHIKKENEDFENLESIQKLQNGSDELYCRQYFNNVENVLKVEEETNFSFQVDENGNEVIVETPMSHDSSVKIRASCENSINNKFKCKFCFCVTTSLLSHFSNEHRDKQLTYSCKFCDFETKYIGNLKEHENSKHEKQNFHLCHICGYQALYRSNLNRHVRHVHFKRTKMNLQFNEKYVCIYCGFITTRKENLKSHMNSLHTLENIFPCKFCKYVATRNDSLKKHIQCIHKENKRSSFDCNTCNFKTERKDFFKLHFRKEHAGLKTFSCDQCDYKATVSCNLKRHVQRKH